MNKKAVLTILFIAGFSIAYAQNSFVRSLKLDTFLGSKILNEFNSQILNAVVSGKIQGYTDETLMIKYSKHNILFRGINEGNYVPHPAKYDSCFLFDSMLLEQIKIRQLNKELKFNRLNEIKYLSKENVEVRFKSLSIVASLSIANTILGYYDVCWIDFNDLNKIFTPEQYRLFLNAIHTETRTRYNNYLSETNLTGSTVDLTQMLGQLTVNDINSKILDGIRKQKITIFTDHTLIIPFDLKKNTTDPLLYYFSDSLYSGLLKTPHLNYEVSKLLKINKNKQGYYYSFKAISISLKIENQNNSFSSYWFKFHEIKSVLNDFEYSLLIYSIFKQTNSDFNSLTLMPVKQF